MRTKSKHAKKKHSNKLEKIILITLIMVFILGSGYICYYYYDIYKSQQEHSTILDNIVIEDTQITENKTERMLQLEELQKENEEVVSWIEISGTNISYPICQTSNNDFYLTHNYKKEQTSGGSLFLDKAYDFSIPSSNLLIYGHRNKKGLMFEDLIKYKDENFYKEHQTIRFTTTTEDTEYEIISVFYSRVYYKSETNVFRYYYFINAETEEEYNEYVTNAKKASIYDTGRTAEYGDQLLTLSTCEYSQEDGRFVVVARKTRQSS